MFFFFFVRIGDRFIQHTATKPEQLYLLIHDHIFRSMIIAKDFIWLHFPKCAGTKTNKVLRKYFGQYYEIHFDKIDQKNVIWHHNVEEREKQSGLDLRNRVVICNFRRLPSWIISRIQFEEKRSGFTTTKDEYTRGIFRVRNGSLTHADKTLKKYTTVNVDEWIRTEYLAKDFKKAFSPFLDLSKINLQNEFSNTVNETNYNKNLSNWYTQDELDLLYSSCPLWANLELLLYGELVFFN